MAQYFDPSSSSWVNVPTHIDPNSGTSYIDPIFQYMQQLRQQQISDERYAQSQRDQARRDAESKQNQAMQAQMDVARQVGQQGQQGAYNTISTQNANEQLAGLGLNFAGDIANQRIQAMRIQGDIAQQAVNNARYVQGLNLNVAQGGADAARAESGYYGNAAQTHNQAMYRSTNDRAKQLLGY